MLLLSPPEILCPSSDWAFFPVALTRKCHISSCNSFLQVLVSELPFPFPGLSQYLLSPGLGAQTEPPGTYTWPQRVRTGWCNTSRHTEQSKEVTGSSGSLLRSRARGVAEAGEDLPLSLLNTEPIADSLTETAAKSSMLAAGLFCCPVVEEGSPGPAVIAASQRAQQPQLRCNL